MPRITRRPTYAMTAITAALRSNAIGHRHHPYRGDICPNRCPLCGLSRDDCRDRYTVRGLTIIDTDTDAEIGIADDIEAALVHAERLNDAAELTDEGAD